MISFWLLACLLILIAIIVILRSLFGNQGNAQVAVDEYAALYRQQLQEIETDFKNGLLTEADAIKTKKETEAAFLDLDEKTNQVKPFHSVHKTTAIILVCLLPVFVIGLYQKLGEPGLIRQQVLINAFKHAASGAEKNESIEKLPALLEKRLEKNPDDINGWLMLTDSYVALERFTDALRAVENVYRLRPDAISVKLRYADIYSTANGTFYGTATALINDVLTMNPNNSTGLWLAGMAAHERGDYAKVVDYWGRLLPQMETGSTAKEHLILMIDSIKSGLEEPIAKDGIPAENSDDGNIELTINVSLAPDLADQVDADDTVFVYAKAIDGAPMPLAVVKKTVEDLPMQITLDNASAMLPNNRLSDHRQVQIIARISKSGNAIQQPGDLIGTIDQILTGHDEPVELKIHDKIQ